MAIWTLSRKILYLVTPTLSVAAVHEICTLFAKTVTALTEPGILGAVVSDALLLTAFALLEDLFDDAALEFKVNVAVGVEVEDEDDGEELVAAWL